MEDTHARQMPRFWGWLRRGVCDADAMDQPLIPADAVLAALHWRYATKKFDSNRKLSAEEWDKLEQALILAPSSYGLQPYRFIVVTDPELRVRLREKAYGQPQITDSSHLVVFAARTDITAADVENYMQRISDVRGVEVAHLDRLAKTIAGDLVTGPRHAMIKEWSARQAYIALGVLVTVAAITSIDVCPMEGFSPQGFNEVLDLEAQGLSAVVIATVGHRAADDGAASVPKVRKTQKTAVDRRS
jgi:nitroreductase